MMKTSCKLLILTVLFCFCACRAELDAPSPGSELQELRISTSTEAGKTTLDDLTICWTEGDQVAAYDGRLVRTLAAESSGTTTVLMGEALAAGSYPLLYPMSGVTGYADGSFQAGIPSTQMASAGGVDPKATLLFGIAEGGAAVMKNV